MSSLHMMVSAVPRMVPGWRCPLGTTHLQFVESAVGNIVIVDASCWWGVLHPCFLSLVLRVESRASCTLSKLSTTELYPKALSLHP